MKKHQVRSCCGKAKQLWELDAPVMKQHSEAFKEAGFVVPAHLFRGGMFYVEWKGLVAVAPFGSAKLSIRCGSKDCQEQLAHLESMLEKVLFKKEADGEEKNTKNS